MRDYILALQSRHASILGRKEVLAGKAKFGIFGDGKELAQIALAKTVQKGDWRSGYYRDQTFMFALGLVNFAQFFAQLYAHANLEKEPCSGGRQMNSHFATPIIDPASGAWLSQMDRVNVSADLSPTAGQMARLVGLGYASKLYRLNPRLSQVQGFSHKGNEVAFGMIGNASTAEGLFWEAVNAMGVLQVPVALSVWDDGYGISVPNRYQMTKGNISKLMAGFSSKPEETGIAIYQCKGWDYFGLVDLYRQGVEEVRTQHKPALFHITEMNQPQGHSTSGSHERYKDEARLHFEQSSDGIACLRHFILDEQLITESALKKREAEATEEVEQAKQRAWQDYQDDVEQAKEGLHQVLADLKGKPSIDTQWIEQHQTALDQYPGLLRRVVHSKAWGLMYDLLGVPEEDKAVLQHFLGEAERIGEERYSTHLYASGASSPLNAAEIPPTYESSPLKVDGRQIIQKYFDLLLARDPRVFIIGEDVGQLGGVNLEFEDLQKTHGELHITDTGIREATILGQGMGAALRGLRPVVDIQYLDYVLYCLQGLSDDLATTRYRSAGQQASPVIVRTKGHRLEGIWHTGSPMGMLLHSLRGMHLCVPRDMTQAAGMYETLLQGDDPALVIEVLNGYRLKEPMPTNLGSYRVPLGVPEILLEGTDLTVATYGACVRIVQEAVTILARLGASIELVDVQTLLPFDTRGIIAASVKKTGAFLVVDEDVPGGASAYIFQQVLERDQAYDWLDSAPRTLTAKNHRSAYGSDGDYYSKPSPDQVVRVVYDMLRERDPQRFTGKIGVSKKT